MLERGNVLAGYGKRRPMLAHHIAHHIVHRWWANVARGGWVGTGGGGGGTHIIELIATIGDGVRTGT